MQSKTYRDHSPRSSNALIAVKSNRCGSPIRLRLKAKLDFTLFRPLCHSKTLQQPRPQQPRGHQLTSASSGIRSEHTCIRFHPGARRVLTAVSGRTLKVADGLTPCILNQYLTVSLHPLIGVRHNFKVFWGSFPLICHSQTRPTTISPRLRVGLPRRFSTFTCGSNFAAGAHAVMPRQNGRCPPPSSQERGCHRPMGTCRSSGTLLPKMYTGCHPCGRT